MVPARTTLLLAFCKACLQHNQLVCQALAPHLLEDCATTHGHAHQAARRPDTHHDNGSQEPSQLFVTRNSPLDKEKKCHRTQTGRV